jgi:hypothetical protein
MTAGPSPSRIWARSGPPLATESPKGRRSGRSDRLETPRSTSLMCTSVSVERTMRMATSIPSRCFRRGRRRRFRRRRRRRLRPPSRNRPRSVARTWRKRRRLRPNRAMGRRRPAFSGAPTLSLAQELPDEWVRTRRLRLCSRRPAPSRRRAKGVGGGRPSGLQRRSWLRIPFPPVPAPSRWPALRFWRQGRSRPPPLRKTSRRCRSRRRNEIPARPGSLPPLLSSRSPVS